MTRRRYPILGRHQLRISDANIRPLKPVYIRYRILGAGLEDQSGLDPGPGSRSRSQVQIQVQDPDLEAQIPVSQILV